MNIKSIFLSGILAVQLFLTAQVQAALIGQWNFEEGSGATAIDSSGNGLNGAISNATYVTGRDGGYALDFNGSNSFVEVADNSLLDSSEVAISFWFNSRSNQVAHADFLDKGHGSGTNPYHAGFAVQYNSNATDFSAFYGNGSYFEGAGSSQGYLDQEWHHVVANLGGPQIELYIDGVLENTVAANGSILANGANLYFGRHKALGRYYNGLLDDIQIYDSALSQSEVSQIYNGTAVSNPTTPLLLGLGLLGLLGIRQRL